MNVSSSCGISLTVFSLVCALASAPAVSAGPTSMVADINTIGDPSSSLLEEGATIVRIGNQFLFVADDGLHGEELWITDGSAGGTAQLIDLWPGPNGSSPDRLTVFDGAVYFSASDGSAAGDELWKTDGTLAGTVLVKDINPSGGSSLGVAVATPEALFFSAFDDTNGSELWTSDGTAAGTQLVKDIRPGSSSSGVGNLTAIGSKVFFNASDGSSGIEPWISDGTLAGTMLLADVATGSTGSVPTEFTARGGNVFFVANDGVNGRELWVTDGTPAFVQMVEDLLPGPDGSNPLALLAWGGALYFGAEDGSAGRELYRFVSPGSGIELFKDIFPGAFGSGPLDLTDVGPRFYFVASDGTSGRELWSSDGTPGGTELLVDIAPGSGSSSPAQLTPTSAQLFFVADDGSSGDELWRTDGRALGTEQVLDIEPSGDSTPFSLTPHPAGGIVFGAAQTVHGTELWRSNGTESGTARLTDAGDYSSNPFPISPLSETMLLLSAWDGTDVELWSTDGTSVGTSVIVSDRLTLAPQYSPPFRSTLQLSNGGVFLGLSPGPPVSAFSTGLIISDGTALGTEQLLSGGIELLGVMDDEGYFGHDDGIDGYELWKTDGTGPGTIQVKDINPNGGSFPRDGVALDDLIVFVALVDLKAQLWSTDGTTVGTTRLLDEWHDDDTGEDFAFASMFGVTRVGDVVFFFGTLEGAPLEGGEQGVQLWKSDGTPGGTTPVDTNLLNAGDAVSLQPYSPRGVARGDDFFFVASDATAGEELWMSDGTELGTSVLDIVPGSGSSTPSSLAVVGNDVFFSACDPVRDHCELWSSDGTLGGTSMVLDIGGIGAEGRPRLLTPVGDRLYFVASDPLLGRELWQSDGTSAGTTVAANISPGIDSSDPSVSPSRRLLVQGGTLFFSADDGTTGREVWRHEAAADLEAGLALLQPPTFVSGEARLELEIINHGPADAAQVLATLPLPAGTTFHASQPPASCTESVGVVTCDFGDVIASSMSSVEVTLETPAAPGILDATAQADAWDPDLDPSNDDATLSFEVHAVGTHIFSDGFESGDVSAWSSSTL